MFRAISNIHRRPGAGTVSIDDLSGPHADLLRVVASELQVEVHLDRVTCPAKGLLQEVRHSFSRWLRGELALRSQFLAVFEKDVRERSHC
jgi:hypothetical protein